MTTYIKQENDVEEVRAPELQAERENETIDSNGVIAEEDTLKIPEEQIPLALKFHPGCHVVCIQFDGRDMQPTVSYGSVLYAAVHLRSLSRDYVYKVQPKPAGEAFLAKEHMLQFAQATPVWVKNSESIEFEAIVFSSQQQSPAEDPIYIVTPVSSQGFHHGIPGRCVRYRVVGPTDENDEIDAPIEEARNYHHDAADHRESASGPAASISLDTRSTNSEDRGPHGKPKHVEAVYEEKSSGDRIERRIFIPGWADNDSAKGILIGTDGRVVNHLSKKHNCRIEWNTPNDQVRHSSLDLEASVVSIEIVTAAIEKAVAMSVKSEVMGLMSYESAILNKHYIDIVGEAAYALGPPHFLDKIWMAGVRFDEEHIDLLGLFIGPRHSGVMSIEAKTNCRIKAERKVLPHFFVTGNTASAVNGCVLEIRKRLEWAIIQRNIRGSVVDKKGLTSSQKDDRYGPASKRTFSDFLSTTSEEFASAGVNEFREESRRKAHSASQESPAKRLRTGSSGQSTTISSRYVHVHEAGYRRPSDVDGGCDVPVEEGRKYLRDATDLSAQRQTNEGIPHHVIHYHVPMHTDEAEPRPRVVGDHPTERRRSNWRDADHLSAPQQAREARAHHVISQYACVPVDEAPHKYAESQPPTNDDVGVTVGHKGTHVKEEVESTPVGTSLIERIEAKEESRRRPKSLEGRWQAPSCKRPPRLLTSPKTTQTTRTITIPSWAQYDKITLSALERDIVREADRLDSRASFNFVVQNGLQRFASIQLAGSVNSVEELAEIVEIEVARSVHEDELFRMIHDLAVANREHSIIQGDAVYVFTPPYFERKAWISTLTLPIENTGFTAVRFIGCNGSGVTAISKATSCFVRAVFNRTTSSPYIYIIGGHIDNVVKCRVLVQRRLTEITNPPNEEEGVAGRR